ncbi:MAG: hypothetical protein NWE94_06510 [Candidatus Bathyarchaeota archaeon]|nr:hypothetical protein [Candidatus Bathyarchaeota archaeon]
MTEISAQLLRVPNLAVFLKLLGSYDLNVDVFVTNFEDLFKSMYEIRKISGISLIEMHLTIVWEK